MGLLEAYLLRFGRPLEFYTDKASLFVTTEKKNHPKREEPLPPTQIGRGLSEVAIGWTASHSPQAKAYYASHCTSSLRCYNLTVRHPF